MRTALLVVDHGSRRDISNQRLSIIADALTLAAPDCLVAYAHMELAEPSIGAAIQQLYDLGARHIHVLPYFLGAGRHITQDIPQLVSAAVTATGFDDDVSYDIGEALGPHDALATLLLQRSPYTNHPSTTLTETPL